MKANEAKEIALRIFEQSIKGKTDCSIWINSPNTFYRWAKNKIKTKDDILVLINPEAPCTHWNCKIVTPDMSTDNTDRTDVENIVDTKKRRGRPKKQDSEV